MDFIRGMRRGFCTLVLFIESRDCIASPENYRIVVTSTDTPSTELVNVSFSPTIEHDVGDVVRPNTQYTITVVLVETTSNTIVEEIITNIMSIYPSITPSQPGFLSVQNYNYGYYAIRCRIEWQYVSCF